MKMYDPHPFLSDKAPLYGLLPPQDYPLKKKTEEWWKNCVDSSEHLARIQYWQKRRLSKNYRLANGEFIAEDYIEQTEPDFDVMSYVSEKAEFPFAKNYDIISQPLNTLLGELDSMPDEFSVVGRGDIFENEKNVLKMEMLKEWFINLSFTFVQETLAQQGIDPQQEFETEEEQQQMQQLIEQKRQLISPPEIEKYFKTKYRNVVELWGEYEMKDQHDRFNLRHKRFREFYHYLVGGERERHIFYDGETLDIATLNPKHVFFHKNPDDEYIQDGNVAGFIEILALPAIIDKYGHELTEEDYTTLSNKWDKEYDPKQFPRTISGKPVTHTDPYGRPYQTKLLTDDPYINQYFPKMKDMSVGIHGFLDEIEMSKMDGFGAGFPYGLNSMCLVVTSYWKSIEKIGKLTWINPETGMFEVREIDENFVIPSYVKVDKKKKPSEPGDINTIIWGRRTVIYQGKKICNYFSDDSTGSLKKPIYFSMRPADIQIGKLPIAGQLSNNVNTVPTSFVDRLRNLQFLHNLVMNQGMHQLMTDIMPFVVAESNIIPDGKDWGEDPIIKWLQLGHATGVAPVNTGPGNTGGSQGNTFPRVVDLDRTTRIMTRFQLAQMIRALAWESVGITPQRLGSVKASETATGVNEAVNRSYSQTGPWFTEFFDCERDILQMQLDAAKYLQSNSLDHSAQYVKSDFTTESIRITANLDLYDLHMYIINNQEHARNLDFAKRMAIENNTSDMPGSERLKLGTEGSLREIYISMKEQEEKMYERNMQEQEKAFQLEQQRIDLEREKEANETEKFYAGLENKLKEATIRALGFQNESDINSNNISDIVEQANLYLKEYDITGKHSIEQEKLNIQRQAEQNKMSAAQLNLQNEREKRAHEKDLKKQDEKIARINDRGKYSGK